MHPGFFCRLASVFAYQSPLFGVEKRFTPKVHPCGVGKENRFASLPVPLIEVVDGIKKILKGQHVRVRFRRVDRFHGDRRVGFVAVSQEQMMLVVTPDRVARGPVIQTSEFP